MKALLMLLSLVTTSAFTQSLSLLDVFSSNPNLPSQNRGGPIQYCTGNLLLNQEPMQANGLFSDIDCDFCGAGVQVMADNFILTNDETITELVIYTGYFPDNTPSTDLWTVSVHADNAGAPGMVLQTETNVPSTRVDTGVDLFGVDEYRHILTLNTPVPLIAGTYWIEIHNDSVGSTESVFWETGNLDTNSIVDSQFATEFPVVTWTPLGTSEEMAIQICGATEPTYFIGGEVTGMLTTNEVLLDNNGSETELVTCNGPFVFDTPIADLSTYSVTELMDPDSPLQDCDVTMGDGTVNGGDVTEILVSCAATTDTDYIFGEGFDCPGLTP